MIFDRNGNPSGAFVFDAKGTPMRKPMGFARGWEEAKQPKVQVDETRTADAVGFQVEGGEEE